MRVNDVDNPINSTKLILKGTCPILELKIMMPSERRTLHNPAYRHLCIITLEVQYGSNDTGKRQHKTNGRPRE